MIRLKLLVGLLALACDEISRYCHRAVRSTSEESTQQARRMTHILERAVLGPEEPRHWFGRIPTKRVRRLQNVR